MSPAAPPPAALFEGPCGSMWGAMHEAVLVIDEAQMIVAINPAAERLLGCPARQALGTSLTRFIPAHWREAHAAHVRAFAAGQASPRVMALGRRIPVLRVDGQTQPVEIMLSRFEMAGRGSSRRYYAALMRDLSDEAALEDQLAALERRMRTAFELSPMAIWICDGDQLAYANRAAARLFGVSSLESLLGRSLATLIDAASYETLRLEMARVLACQEPSALVAGRLTRPDGEPREVEIALAALPDHGHTTVQMVVNDVTERRRESSDLERSRRDLRDLSASVVEAREEERRRIARELHDELGQRLTALKIDLENLAVSAGMGSDDGRVAGMSSMIDDTLASVRRIASDLRPLMLDDLGLTAAIEWLARDASRRMGIPVHARLPLAEPELDQRVAIALYRMVQEALTNVARHAQAKAVEVELRVKGSSLLLAVSDDGVGMADEALQRSGSFGLMGLRERAHMLGGEVTIGRRAGGGTRLSVRLPAHPVALAHAH